MRTLITLIRKEIHLFLANHTAVALTFVVPFVMIFIFGQVFGINESGGSGPSGIPLAVVIEGENPVAQDILAALEKESAFAVRTTIQDPAGTAQSLTETSVRTLITTNKLRFGLVFPAKAADDDSFALRVKFLTNPRNEIETQMANGLLQKTIFTAAPQAIFQGLRQRAEKTIGSARTEAFYDRMADTIASSFDGDRDEIRASLDDNPFAVTASGEADAESNGAQNFLDQIVKIETEQLAGQQVKNPAGTRLVGGWAIMFLLFSVSGSATSLFAEKDAGLFHRILAGPVSRTSILWSKWLFNIGMGLTQLTVMFLAGQLLFGIEVLPQLGSVLVVGVCAAAACSACGMLIASIASSPAAAQGFTTFLVLSMSAIGGAWFPITFMPDFIQTIAHFTVVYWSIEGFMQVLWAGQSAWEILPILGVLLGIAAGVGGLAFWRFQKGNLFT